MVKITIKTPSQNKPFTLDIDTGTVHTVLQLKQKVGAYTGDPKENIKLIFRGRIIQGNQSLNSLNMNQQETMHAAIKKPDTQLFFKQEEKSQKSEMSNSDISSENKNIGGFRGMEEMIRKEEMGGMKQKGGISGMDPQKLKEMMANISPQQMQQIISSNPMVKQMVQSNPQLRMMLSNPQILKSVMNPATIQTAMQNMQGAGMGNMGKMKKQQQPKDLKQTYKNQLEMLKEMGFTDENKNIQALKQTKGDIDDAIELIANEES